MYGNVLFVWGLGFDFLPEGMMHGDIRHAVSFPPLQNDDKRLALQITPGDPERFSAPADP